MIAWYNPILRAIMTTNKTVRIYSLHDPRVNSVRYVGFTSRTLEERLAAHLYRKEGNSHRVNWIRKLINDGVIPIILLLEEVPFSDYEIAERWWITHFKKQGANLVNATDGGDGSPGRIQSKEEIAKRIQSRAGYKHSMVTRQKISRANKGQIPWTTGRVVPDMVRDKIRVSLIGHEVSAETRVKIGAYSRGIKASKETRLKMSKAHSGKTHSEKSKSKMRGRKISEDTRIRMRIAAQERVRRQRDALWGLGITSIEEQKIINKPDDVTYDGKRV